MTVIELKKLIEEKKLNSDPLIFRYEDVPFLCYQYVREISKATSRTIRYLEEFVPDESNDIFGISEVGDESLRVYRCDILDFDLSELDNEKNIIIITGKIEKEVERGNQNIVIFPKLEGWQIKDYVYSVAEGIPENELDWLIDVCNSDIYRLENELDKIRVFEVNERKYLFSDMKFQGNFRDLSTFNVFDITNAITRKDIESLKNALKDIESFDAEPLGVVTLLYSGFRKLIQVWLSKNPTPDNTGLKSNVIYAIKNSPRVYSKDQLVKIFLLLTSVDKMLKTGDIDTKWLISWIVCKILAC